MAGEHLEEDFPFLKLPLSDLSILQPKQRKHSETLRAASKSHIKNHHCHYKDLPVTFLSPAHRSQWPSWPQAPTLWLATPWAAQTWQPQVCFLRPCMAFSCRSGACMLGLELIRWILLSQDTQGTLLAGPAVTRVISAVWIHGQVTLWGSNTCKGPFFCSTQQELTHGRLQEHEFKQLVRALLHLKSTKNSRYQVIPDANKLPWFH